MGDFSWRGKFLEIPHLIALYVTFDHFSPLNVIIIISFPPNDKRKSGVFGIVLLFFLPILKKFFHDANIDSNGCLSDCFPRKKLVFSPHFFRLSLLFHWKVIGPGEFVKTHQNSLPFFGKNKNLLRIFSKTHLLFWIFPPTKELKRKGLESKMICDRVLTPSY